MSLGELPGQDVVRRRHVLFFGGFDPKGAAWYHGMYRRHAAQQSAINGMRIGIGPRERDAARNAFWIVQAQDAGTNACETRFEVVAWDAVVRGHWTRSPTRVLLQLLAAYALMLWHGPRQVLKVARMARRSLYALGFPLLLFLAAVLVALLAAWVAGRVALGLGTAAWLAWVYGIVSGVVVLAGVLRLESRFQTGLLARIYAFVCRYAVRGMPELDAAIAHGARRINEALQAGDCDEVLVVGYSVGNILATRAMGQALAARVAGKTGQPALALLTLGNCVPLLGLFPQAAIFREELATIAASDCLRWIDVSSPVDWASFPLIDPLELCDVPCARRGTGSPQMTSPRFHTLIEPARYAELVRDKHAMHTLYLMSTDHPGQYDWFAITAGSQYLASRYASPARRRSA